MLETISRPYTRAIFALAQEEKREREWMEFLGTMTEILADKKLLGHLKNPTLGFEVKKKVLVEVIEVAWGKGKFAGDAEGSSQLRKKAPSGTGKGESFGGLGEAEKRFLELLIKNKRADCLPTIAQLFSKLRQEAEHTKEVEVTSAHVLTSAEKANLEKCLAERLGKKISLHEKVDASLLGGVVVTWDDKTLDGSVRGKLDKLIANL